MTELKLSDDEVETLRQVLESYLSDLRMEIADTDRQDFREMLKARKATLLRILEGLPVPAAS